MHIWRLLIGVIILVAALYVIQHDTPSLNMCNASISTLGGIGQTLSPDLKAKCDDIRNELNYAYAGALIGIVIILTAFIGKGKVGAEKPATSEGSEKVKETLEIVYLRCKKCKTKNDEDAEYCKKCGEKL